MRESSPTDYLKVIARVIPAKLELSREDSGLEHMTTQEQLAGLVEMLPPGKLKGIFEQAK